MAFGVKVKSVKTKKDYTIEELYEAIKDHTFTAGEPSLTKHGLAYVITFPPLDRQNQVWVMQGGMKKSGNKFSVQKQEAAGVGNMAANMALDKLTGGFFGIGGVAGSTVKKAEQLVEATAKELNEMGL